MEQEGNLLGNQIEEGIDSQFEVLQLIHNNHNQQPQQEEEKIEIE